MFSYCLVVDGLLTSIVSIFKHSKRGHGLLQGHLEYVMHTFELASPKVSNSLRFPRVLACSRSELFNFRLLLAPANCLEIVQQIRDFRGDCLIF